MKQKFLKIGSLLMVTAAMLVAFSTTSCEKKEKDPTLTVEPATFTEKVAVEGGTVSLIIKSTNTDWTITAPSWLEPAEKTGSGDKTVVVTVTANTGAERNGDIVITSVKDSSLKHTRTVTQLGVPVEKPEAAGEITGPTSGEGSVELTAPTIARAETYVWYKDGTVIPSATANKYTATASGDYQVAGKNSAGEGDKSPVKTVTITEVPAPGPAGAITGPTTGEGSVELTAPTIENATTYAWYKDGSKIANATAKTYTATESGKYQVAGVNSVGVEGEKSPEHEVTITGDPGTQFVDELVGTWEVSGFIWINPQTGDPTVYRDEHELIITKVDNNRVLISGMLDLANLYPDDDTVDEVYGTVDNEAKTLSIASQQMVPTWDADGWDVYMCSVVSLTFAECWGVGFENLTVEDGVIALWKDGARRGTVDGVDSYGSIIGLTQDPDDASQVYWYRWHYADTEWTKVSNSTSFNYVNKPKARVEVSKTRINQASL